jgi:hypothetical protein
LYTYTRIRLHIYTRIHTYIYIDYKSYIFYFIDIDACGGIFETSNGTITSPSFPETYPGNKHCFWEIIAPLQYRITLNFTHFDLEGNHVYEQPCEYDWVEVSSKFGDDLLKKHGIYCGSKSPPLITSESNSLKIIFSSDNRLVRWIFFHDFTLINCKFSI